MNAEAAPAGTAARAPTDWRRQLPRNAAWSIGGRMVFLAGWAALTPALLQMLGSERFAIWALFFTLSAYFATFDLGLSQALVRFVSEVPPERAREVRGAVTLTLLVYGAVAVLAVAALALAREPILDLIRTPPALRAESGAGLVAMAALLGASNLIGVGGAVLAGRQRMDLAQQAVLTGTLVQLAASVAVVVRGGGLLDLILAMAAGTLASGVMTWRAVSAVAPEARFDGSALASVNVAQLARFGGAVQITHAAFLIRTQADKLLLAHFVALAAVTPFELGWRIAIAVWTTPALIVMPLVPAFSQLASAGDHSRLARLGAGANRLLMMAAFPLAGFSFAVAPGLVSLWLGHPESGVIRALTAMTAFWLAIILTGVGTAALRGRGRPGPEAWVHSLGCALHLGLSLWLVPARGFEGALTAMSVSGIATGVALLGVSMPATGMAWRGWARDALRALGLAVLATVSARLLAGVIMPAPQTRLEGAVATALVGAVFAVVTVAGYAWMGWLGRDSWSPLRASVPSDEPMIQK